MNIHLIYGLGTKKTYAPAMFEKLATIGTVYRHEWNGPVEDEIDQAQSKCLAEPFFVVGHSYGGDRLRKILLSGRFDGRIRAAAFVDPVPRVGFFGIRRILQLWRRTWKVPPKLPCLCLYRVDRIGDGEIIDGHPLAGAINRKVDIGHSDFLNSWQAIREVEDFLLLNETAAMEDK